MHNNFNRFEDFAKKKVFFIYWVETDVNIWAMYVIQVS